jgi:hypothetical protein
VEAGGCLWGIGSAGAVVYRPVCDLAVDRLKFAAIPHKTALLTAHFAGTSNGWMIAGGANRRKGVVEQRSLNCFDCVLGTLDCRIYKG